MREGTPWSVVSAAFIVCAVLLGGRIAAQTPPLNHVRSSNQSLADLINRAERGSSTFNGLLSIIQMSDGIVYVEPGTCGHGVRACLKVWMQASGSNRFLRIEIAPSHSQDDLDIMAAIGHELQHAIEVLDDPAVKDGVTMFNVLKRTAPTDGNRFETTRAVNVGNAVYDELRGTK
jgi:hypothetical protein